MNDVAVVEVGREAMLVVLLVSAPLLAAALAVGVTIAVFQALTSIQEMTLTFVPKIVTVFIVMVIALPFMMRTVVEFGHNQFDRIVGLGAG